MTIARFRVVETCGGHRHRGKDLQRDTVTVTVTTGSEKAQGPGTETVVRPGREVGARGPEPPAGLVLREGRRRWQPLGPAAPPESPASSRTSYGKGPHTHTLIERREGNAC